MKKRRLVLLAAAALWMIAGCDTHTSAEPDEGMVSVTVGGVALSAADIAAVKVTVTGDGISPEITAMLEEASSGEWTGLVEAIPAGDERIFLAEAFDEDDTIIYSGTVDGVVIEGDVTTQVSIFLQPTEPPETFDNAVPIITAFTASPTTVMVGETVALTVVAMDADEGDVLTYLWSADDGTLSSTTLPETTWTAPTVAGAYTVAVSVTDPKDASAELLATINVVDGVAAGRAEIEIGVNTAPEILGLVPTPTRIDVGESTTLDLTAVDPDGDEVFFMWWADCNGSFDDSGAEDPTFTLTWLTGNTCTLTVYVNDGSYVTNQAKIVIETGPPVVVETEQDEAVSASLAGVPDESDVCQGRECQ